MGEFKEKVKEAGLSWQMEYNELRPLDYKGLNLLLYKNILEIIKSKEKVLIVPDPDVDGTLAATEMKKTFDFLGYKRYDIHPLKNKGHGIDNELVYKVIQRYDAVIILDSSTNEVDKLAKLISFKKRVIVIDHHLQTKATPDGVVMLNSKSINSNWNMSAGAFVGVLMFEFFNNLKKPHEALYMLKLGAITLYSDCMYMDEINTQIAQKALFTKTSMYPAEIEKFIGEHDTYCRSFFNFKLNNKINAAMREGKFEIINRWLNEVCIIEDFERTYQNSRETQILLREKCDILGDYKNIKFVAIPDLPNSLNYTGLLANKIKEETGKLTIALHPSLKGSVRDNQSRDILDYFSMFYKAGGHKSAFGFFLDYDQIQEFKLFLDSLDHKLISRPNKDIIVTDRSEVGLMAEFNEVSNISAYLGLYVDNNFEIKNFNNKKWIVTDGRISVTAFKPVIKGSNIMIKPTVTKKGIELLAQGYSIDT